MNKIMNSVPSMRLSNFPFNDDRYVHSIMRDLAKRLVTAGLTVYLAKSGTYGFYTDEKCERVVSFQYSLGLSFSGHYASSNARRCGQGWQITDDSINLNGTNFRNMLKAVPPQWAVHDHPWSYKTAEQLLGDYHRSSRYTRVI